MDTTSPVLDDALFLLRDNLYEHLDEVEFLAMKYESWSEQDAETARAVIPDLVAVIRGVAVLHEKTDAGTCRDCAAAWPCPPFETLHRLVKDPEREFVKLVTRVRADR